MKCPINLKDHQKQTSNDILTSITQKGIFSYLDVSRTGLGKTFEALWTAWHLQHIYGIQPVWVAPSSQSLHGEDGVLAHAKTYGIDLAIATTYSGLIARKGKVHHQWLIYDKDTKQYYATGKFNDLATKGVFLIFDEVHKATRNSQTHRACAALVRACTKYAAKCRVGLLSFTPADKDEHYPQLLAMMGYITNPKLYHVTPFKSDYTWDEYGLGQLLYVCKQFNPTFDGEALLKDVKLNKKYIHSVCRELYQKCIKNKVTFAMPVPSTPHTPTLVNYFMNTEDTDTDTINQGISVLKNAVAWQNDEAGDQREWNMGGIVNGLKIIERGKLNSMIRYIREQTTLYPNKKFVLAIGARCKDHQKYIQKNLKRRLITDSMWITLNLLRKNHSDWSKLNKDVLRLIATYVAHMQPTTPDIMNGDVSVANRVKLMSKFQSPLNDSWCLIMTPGVGAESISLHDTHGNHPREMLISPDYFHARTCQAAGRVDRVGTKSDSKVMMVYSKFANMETSVINSMVVKSQKAKELLMDSQKELFPGDYPHVYED